MKSSRSSRCWVVDIHLLFGCWHQSVSATGVGVLIMLYEITYSTTKCLIYDSPFNRPPPASMTYENNDILLINIISHTCRSQREGVHANPLFINPIFGNDPTPHHHHNIHDNSGLRTPESSNPSDCPDSYAEASPKNHFGT